MIRSVFASILCAAVLFSANPAPRPAPNYMIHLFPGTVTPAQYKGKVVVMAFIMTTCPHCQNTTVMLSGLQKEYGPKGLQVMAAAFNENANGLVPSFITQFKPTFPVGYTTREEVMAFLNPPKDEGVYVPILIFIDRKGMIRKTYLGDDPFFQKDQENNLRQHIEQLLSEGQPAPAAKKQTKQQTVVITPNK